MRKNNPLTAAKIKSLPSKSSPLAIIGLLLLSGLFHSSFSSEVTEREKSRGNTAFDKTLKLQGISFHIQCPNDSSLNQVTLTPKGLEGDNSVITVEADGTVTGAEVADLNADGSPEIYIYVTSAGSGSYASLIAYSANKLKSLSEIHLPELADDKKLSIGYMGHDEFAVVENTLARRFPIYKEGDSNARPSGKTRQIQYKLGAGEASWILKIDRVVEF